MKLFGLVFAISAVALSFLAPPVFAQMAGPRNAERVAENWVKLVVEQTGSWGGSLDPEVGDVRDFRRGHRKVGYYVPVKPQGFVVVSLRKELAPVKAYSETCDLDLSDTRGMVDLLTVSMGDILKEVEKRVGPINSARSEDVQKILEINYRRLWRTLDPSDQDAGTSVQSGEPDTANYLEGDVVLAETWHQSAPYNLFCPVGDPCAHTLVGCVATAMSQAMHHWSWPPYGEGSPYSDSYDWRNMPDSPEDTTTTAQKNAVAELCAEAGQSVNMDYGCDASGAYFADEDNAFEGHFRYASSASIRWRKNYDRIDWFNLLKGQLNLNRPVPYRIKGHAIIADGWRELGSGDSIYRQYHMNYGWGGSYNTWYYVDSLHYVADGSTTDDEGMLIGLVPVNAMNGYMSGDYSPPTGFPYRYFDRDATGSSATFYEGHKLQFLPGVTATCTSTTGGSIRFYGSGSAITKLFSRGDQSKGIRIQGGAVKLYKDGSIVFR